MDAQHICDVCGHRVEHGREHSPERDPADKQRPLLLLGTCSVGRGERERRTRALTVEVRISVLRVRRGGWAFRCCIEGVIQTRRSMRCESCIVRKLSSGGKVVAGASTECGFGLRSFSQSLGFVIPRGQNMYHGGGRGARRGGGDPQSGCNGRIARDE